MKSFEAKISKALKPSNNVETEKMKRKTVKAEDASGSCGNGITYTFKAATGTLTISGNGAMADYKYDNHAPWYSYCDSITSVTIGNGVTSIGNRAFESCSSLTSLNIWNSIASIGEYAFYGCSALAYITIPVTVTSIGNCAFLDCSALTEISIPHSVTALGGDLFQGCTSLKSITFNNDYSLEQIKTYTNQLKGQIEKIELGPLVTTIPSNMFYGFSKLASINIPHGVISIGGFAFQQCTSLTSITIPDTVTSIGIQAFNGCSSLTLLKIGSGVTSIGSSAFSGCNALTSLEIGNDYVLNNAYLVLRSYDQITSLSLGYSVTSCSANFISRLTNLQSINVAQNNDYLKSEDGVLFSKDGSTLVAYPPKKETTSYTIPDGVTSIGNYAFSGCSSLTSVVIGNGVTSIGDYAFSGCSGLTSITYLGINEPEYGSYVFDSCDKLTVVNVPQGYNKNTFCGKPVNKTAISDTPGEGDTTSEGELPATTGEGDSSSEDDNDPPPPGDSNKGSSKAGVIAGSVVAAVAVVAAIAVTAVMYVKKLACFANAAASASEGGAPAEEV